MKQHHSVVKRVLSAFADILQDFYEITGPKSYRADFVKTLNAESFLLPRRIRELVSVLICAWVGPVIGSLYIFGTTSAALLAVLLISRGLHWNTDHLWILVTISWVIGAIAGSVGAAITQDVSKESEMNVAHYWTCTLCALAWMYPPPAHTTYAMIAALNAGVYAGCYVVKKFAEVRVA